MSTFKKYGEKPKVVDGSNKSDWNSEIQESVELNYGKCRSVFEAEPRSGTKIQDVDIFPWTFIELQY